MDVKKVIAGTALVGTLLVGVAGVSYATTPSSSTAQATTTPNGTAAKAKHPVLARRERRAAFKTVLDQTHTTAVDLKAGLKSGQTVAQYAAAHGSSAQAVHDALVTKFSAAIDKAVSNGKVTQTQADTLKQNLPTRIDKFLNRSWTTA
jgi:hypothetical protein